MRKERIGRREEGLMKKGDKEDVICCYKYDYFEQLFNIYEGRKSNQREEDGEISMRFDGRRM